MGSYELPMIPMIPMSFLWDFYELPMNHMSFLWGSYELTMISKLLNSYDLKLFVGASYKLPTGFL